MQQVFHMCSTLLRRKMPDSRLWHAEKKLVLSFCHKALIYIKKVNSHTIKFHQKADSKVLECFANVWIVKVEIVSHPSSRWLYHSVQLPQFHNLTFQRCVYLWVLFCLDAPRRSVPAVRRCSAQTRWLGRGGREECDFDVEEETTQGERPRRGGWEERWGDIPSRCETAPGPTVFKSAHKQKPKRWCWAEVRKDMHELTAGNEAGVNRFLVFELHSRYVL